MTEQEINRVVLYVTATTSYGREEVDLVVRTCLRELAALAANQRESFARETLMEYVCQWTIKSTGQSEPFVREILGCAGRWLDEASAAPTASPSEASGAQDEDDGLSTA